MSAERRAWLAVFALALVARFALAGAISARNAPDGFFAVDSGGYWRLAGNLIGHGVFSQSAAPPLEPDAQRTPGYPLFLAALRGLGLGPLAVVAVQSLLGALTALLVARLALRWSGGRDAALVAGAFVALDVPSIASANLLLSETLFTLLLVASATALAAAWRRGGAGPAALAGALLGAALLCRPLAILLPVVWGGLLATLLVRRRLPWARASAAFALAAAVVVAPWLLRNQRVFGAPLLSTIGAVNLYEYRAAAVRAELDGTPLAASRNALIAEAAARFPGDPERDRTAFERFEGGLAPAILLEHPGIALRNHVVALVSVFFHPMRSALDLQLGLARTGNTLATWGERPQASLLERLRAQTSAPALALVAFQIGALALLWIGASVGFAVAIRSPAAPVALLVGSLVLYCAALLGGPEADARFRVPLIPFLALLAGPGWCALARLRA